ncbi:MAG: hypothetical protein LBF94_02030 [Puniceicoccales bacterium]|jgi:hypothetical protein|nr:hypothetical protein [Puniceicoccales bacterium]
MDDISTRVQEIIDQVRDKSPGKVCPVTSGKRIIGQVKVMRGGFLWLFKRIEVTFFQMRKQLLEPIMVTLHET